MANDREEPPMQTVRQPPGARSIDDMLAQHDGDEPVTFSPEAIRSARADRAVALYTARDDVTIVEVAKEMGVSPYTVRRDLIFRGVEIRQDPIGGNRRRASEERAAIIRDMHERGASSQDIADHLGMTEGSVRERMKKMGLWESRRGAPTLSLGSVAANALHEQSIYAELLLEQDLDLVTLTEDQVKAWEQTAAKIGRGLAHVRRRLRKGANP